MAERNEDALAPLAPGPTLTISAGALSVEIAPAAGGRVAQIRHGEVEHLVGFGDDNAAAIAWGSYPMVPWAGRIRRGRFDFDGRSHQLPINLGEHAIHGVAFTMPWQVDSRSPRHVELSLQLPQDERWPFGGVARQRLDVDADRLEMLLSVTAGAQPMPFAIGWHPWFRKPDRIEFSPSRFFPRDAEGMATLPLAEPPPGPWDDCFINVAPVLVHRGGQTIRLSSDCRHWVVFDEPTHATCIEPQSGPPDAFNLAPERLAPGGTVSARYRMEWL